jgi:hypothetical protein
MKLRTKVKIATAAAIVASAVTTPVALALTGGTPDVRDVTAVFSLAQKGVPIINTCAGPDGVTPYQEQIGRTWVGTLNDTSSSDPYSLTGKLKVVGTFVINGATGEGVGIGTMTLTNKSTGAVIAKGPFTLPTQITDPSTGAAVVRGMINAPLYTGGVKNGYNLVANLEASLNGSTNALTGFMGETAGAPAVPDIAAEFNNQGCP